MYKKGKNVKLSIVIPCLNEGSTIEKTIFMAKNAIAKSGFEGEVVISDNGSSDNSVAISKTLECRVVHVKEKGYGSALLKGIQAANGQYIIIGDADATYDFRESLSFIRALKKGADIVIGSRLKGNIMPDAMPFLHRHIGTPFLTFLINIFFGTRITDVNCGMRAFYKKSFDTLQIVSRGMEFTSEMVIKAKIHRMKIVEIPITLYPRLHINKPHLKTWRDGWRHLQLILQFFFQYRLLKAESKIL